MKEVTKESFYKILVFVSFTIWLLSTWYFGWNDTAENGAEKAIDTMTWLGIIWGVLGDITQNLKITKIDNTYIGSNAKTIDFTYKTKQQ